MRSVLSSRRASWLAILSGATALAVDLAGCAQNPQEQPLHIGESREALSAYCTANVIGVGSLDTENDYLPHVVQCEDGGGGLEALKAQAVAARTYLYYKMSSSGSIMDGQGDQVYSCGRTPTAQQVQAVHDTSGQVLQYMGTTIAAFFVAGAYQSPPGCSGGTNDPTGTEGDVTYNEGLSGSNITQSPLGWVNPGNKENRGCMSQNGANCLASAGQSYDQILKFYYGADISIVTAQGSCVQPSCMDACTNGATQCSGSQVQSCGIPSGSMCTVWSAPSNCPGGQTCSGSACASDWGGQYVSQSFPPAGQAPLVMHPGESLPAYIELKNTGVNAWDQNTKLGTTQPRDRMSVFAASDWLAPNRPSHVASGSVAPGSSYKFQFTLQAPQTLGNYKEYFGILQEGVTWFSDSGEGGPPDNLLEANIQVAPYDWAAELVSTSFTNASVNPILMVPGEDLPVMVVLKNTGAQTWDQSTKLGTTLPHDRVSAFVGPDWLSPTRPANVATGTVAPGQSYSFQFTLHAPSTLGDYHETFDLVQELVHWFSDPGEGGPPDNGLELFIRVGDSSVGAGGASLGAGAAGASSPVGAGGSSGRGGAGGSSYTTSDQVSVGEGSVSSGSCSLSAKVESGEQGPGGLWGLLGLALLPYGVRRARGRFRRS